MTYISCCFININNGLLVVKCYSSFVVSGFSRNEFNSCIIFNFCYCSIYFYVMLRLRGISFLSYCYNYLFKFSFVDFIVIFDLIMLKFYLFFYLFIFNLMVLLKCFLYFGMCSNYCGISKSFYYFVLGYVVNYFLGIRQIFMSACLTKTSFLVSF